MARRLLRWIAVALLVSVTFLWPVATTPAQSAGKDDTTTSDKPDRTPAAQYAVAVLVALSVLVIVCKPSRKG
jgi:hypothetical protein